MRYCVEMVLGKLILVDQMSNQKKKKKCFTKPRKIHDKSKDILL